MNLRKGKALATTVARASESRNAAYQKVFEKLAKMARPKKS